MAQKGHFLYQSSGDKVSLNGEWAFYDGQFLDPAAGKSYPKPDAWVKVPGVWNGTRINGRRIDGHGFATYTLTVTDLVPGETYSLAVYEVGTSYRLYIDGSLAAQAGVPGTNSTSTKGWMASHTADFTPRSDQIQLVMHVANYQNFFGGIWRPLSLGTPEQIDRHKVGIAVFVLVFVGFLILGGLLQVILSLINRSHREFLFFGLFCFGISLRAMIEGELLLAYLFPDATLELGFKVLYLASYLCLPFYALFLKTVMSELVSVWVTRIAVLSGLLFSIMVVLTPMRIFTAGMLVMNALIILYSIYVTAMAVIAVIRKREGSVFFLVSALVLMLSMVHDNLQAVFKFTTPNIAHFGLAFYLFLQTVQLLVRFSKISRSVEILPAVSVELLGLFCSRYNLSGREAEILKLLVSGKTSSVIGQELFLSLSTVKKAVSTIYGKTGVKNKLELIRLIGAGENTGA